jgi:UDP-N-acetylmuramyl pentapeptide phosphotransferase/UDP-N-acetylglucosamine-1-phosphate transferase
MKPEAIMTAIAILPLTFMLGMAGAWFMSRYAFRLGLIDLPNARSSHTTPTPRGGGVGILIAFILCAFVLKLPIGVLCPAALLAVLSFLDDCLKLSSKLRLGLQLFAAIIVVVIFGIGSEKSALYFFLLIFWPIFIVATTNFYNFMDGINGIAGITGVVGFLLIALFGVLSMASQTPIFLSFGLALACLGFLPFNFPKAKVFMGDVGSVLLGFVFAVLVFWLTEGLADFLCLASFMFPFYVDALTTLYIRWRDGEKLYQAHRRHLYQILANEFAYPHWRVSLGYGGTQLLFGLLMIIGWRLGLIWQVLFLVLFAIVSVGCMVLVRKSKKITL